MRHAYAVMQRLDTRSTGRGISARYFSTGCTATGSEAGCGTLQRNRSVVPKQTRRVPYCRDVEVGGTCVALSWVWCCKYRIVGTSAVPDLVRLPRRALPCILTSLCLVSRLPLSVPILSSLLPSYTDSSCTSAICKPPRPGCTTAIPPVPIHQNRGISHSFYLF